MGINAATGEYIGFVDSDDYIDLDFYEKLYYAAKDNSAEIAVAGIISNTIIKKRAHLLIDKQNVTNDYLEKLILCDIPDLSYVWNKIYKLEKIKEYNLKFEEGIFYEDVIFTPMVMCKLGKMVTVLNINYYYLRRNNSIVRKKNDKAMKNKVYAENKAQEIFRKLGVDVSKHSTYSKKYRIFGVTIFAIRTKRNVTTYTLFNVIKYKKVNAKQQKDGF